MADSDLQGPGGEGEDLAGRLARLEREEAAFQAQLRSLEEQNAGLRARAAYLRQWRDAHPLRGLALGVVAGQGESGDPTALDQEGRVPVRLPWDGQTNTLKARLCLPWNIDRGGVAVIPRQGQSVYLAFENGQADRPVIVGYQPDAVTPLDYDPTAAGPATVLAATQDQAGNAVAPATQNQYKSLLRARTPGQGGKLKEIALVDQPGEEEMSLTSQGGLRGQVTGDHYHTVGGDETEVTTGEGYERLQADYTHNLDDDFERRVGGHFQSYISGNKRQAVTGAYRLTVAGQYSMTAQAGSSVTYIWQTTANNLFLGGKNKIVLGEEIDVILPARFSGELFVEDVYVQRAQFYLKTTAYTGALFGNYVSEVRNTLLAIKNAASKVKTDGAVMEEDAVDVGASTTEMKTFATALFTGIKTNA
ncbi:MAG: hypothetical protein KQJ78_03130 [Deltaproteobacteria bacterium]|nr:hypothetical protein [Deltaproteobacteria bacterium]